MRGKSGITGLRLPGNNLYPLKLMTKIYNLACTQASEIGVDISLYTHTPVNSVKSGGSNGASANHRISTARGDFDTKQVVYATNAYTSHLLPHFATGKSKIVPCRGQVLAVRPNEDKQPFWTTGFCACCLISDQAAGSADRSPSVHQRTTKALSISSSAQRRNGPVCLPFPT